MEPTNAAGLGLVPDAPAGDAPAPEDNVEAPKEEPKETPEETPKETEETPTKTPAKPKEIEVEARNYSEPKKEKPLKIDDDMDPEDRARVQSMIDEEKVSANKEIQELRNAVAVGEFVRNNPEFGEYETAVAKYSQHPAFTNVPIDMIAKALAFDDAQAMGAKKEREAQVKVAETKSPGTTVRKKSAGKDISKMSNKEFEKHVAQKKANYGK